MKDFTIALFAEDLSTADLDSIYNLNQANVPEVGSCLLYTSDAADE